MVPIAGNLTAFQPVQHVQTPHKKISACIYTFVNLSGPHNGFSGNHSREATYYDHRVSLQGTQSSIEHNIGSDIAVGLNTSHTGLEHIASNAIITSDKKQKR